MYLKESDPSLQPASPERAAAKLARVARCNAHFGGASALVLLEKLEDSPHHDLYRWAVSEAYSGDSIGDCAFYECPECGSSHFGEMTAAECCEEF